MGLSATTGAAGSLGIRRAEILGGQGRRLFRGIFPLFKELTGQQLEALRTGGVGAQIPVIQRAVEQTRLATARGLTDVEQGLAAQGLAGTPFAARMQAQLAQQGRLAASQIPTNIAQQFIAGIPGQIQTGLGGAAQLGGASAQALANLAGATAAASGAEAQAKGTAIAGIGEGLGAFAGCDKRLKRDIVYVGESPLGFGIYEFAYNGGTTRYRGPLAQDVMLKKPSAVALDRRGYLFVNLAAIDVPLEAI
jgi:hypothetical protein